MSREHFKCSLPLPTGHIVGKMHMSSKCTQHVITSFQAPSPPVKTMAGVCRKYDTNFQEIGVSVRCCHTGWVSHEAAIEKINERCTCGADDSEDDFETVETVSSPSPVGTPLVPEQAPLQVMPAFHVRQVTWARFVQPIDLSFIDASSSGRGPFAVES